MTKKLLLIICFVPLFTFADMSNYQIAMVNIVDSLISMTTNQTTTITALSGRAMDIVSLGELVPPDNPYYQTVGNIIDQANHIDSMASYLSGINAQRYDNLLSLRESIANMNFDNIGDITNSLDYVCSKLDDIYNLLYAQEFSTYLYNIKSYLDLIQSYTYTIDDNVDSIKTKVSQIFTYISDMIVNIRTIESTLSDIEYNTRGSVYRLQTIINNFNTFSQSWNNHADHQDSFYSNITYQVSQILSDLSNFSISNLNADIDFTPITGVITNIPEYWEMILPSINDYTKDRSFYSYFYPEINSQGQVRRIGYNFDLGSQIFPDAFEEGNLHDYATYNPFMYLILFSYYNTTALSAIANWGYLINSKSQSILNNLTNISEKVNSIDVTTKSLESHARDIQVAFSTNNLILGQQLSRLDYIQSLFSNNVPIASLNHASWDWHMFFTNFYLYASLGPENYNITNVGVSSTWHDSTNWFNRIEALLAALVFKDDNSGRVNTNVVSTSATESAVSDVTTSLRSVVEIDNSFSQNVSSSSNTILDMLTEWTQQITASARLNSSFDMFSIPHMVTDDGQVHPEDSPASGDWAFRIGVQDNEVGDFIQFIRSLTTVLWLCVFMFFALKMSLFLLICTCKFVYFCYVVFSSMMGGD